MAEEEIRAFLNAMTPDDKRVVLTMMREVMDILCQAQTPAYLPRSKKPRCNFMRFGLPHLKFPAPQYRLPRLL